MEWLGRGGARGAYMQELTTENETLVRQCYADFAAGDIDGLLSRLGRNCQWIEPAGWPAPANNVGRQAIHDNVFAKMADHFDPLLVQPEQFISAGDNTCVLGRFTGNVASTGDELDVRFCHVWTVVDGKVTRLENIANCWGLPEFE